MKLIDYLQGEGALSVTELAKRIGAPSAVQVRQWQHSYANRRPSPSYSRKLEEVTGGKVMRWDTRPDDWFEIWPELRKRKDAPPLKAEA